MQKIIFPQPVHIQGCTRWRLSDLERYEAAAIGETPPRRDSDTELYLSAKQVAERYAASVPSVWRWAKNGRSAA